MKKIVLLLAVIMASCGHDHDKDKVLGTVYAVYQKELKDSLNKFTTKMLVQRKKIIDSMRVVNKRAPEGKGWYSATEMHLPPGTIMDFDPDELSYKGPGPYLIIVKGFDGKLNICKINREKWLMFHRGDVLK